MSPVRVAAVCRRLGGFHGTAESGQQQVSRIWSAQEQCHHAQAGIAAGRLSHERGVQVCGRHAALSMRFLTAVAVYVAASLHCCAWRAAG